MKKKSIFRLMRMIVISISRISEMEKRVEDIGNAISVYKPYLSKREAAQYLDVTPNFINSMIRNKDISYYMPRENGNAVYISREELDRYITRKRYRSRQEIERQLR